MGEDEAWEALQEARVRPRSRKGPLHDAIEGTQEGGFTQYLLAKGYGGPVVDHNPNPVGVSSRIHSIEVRGYVVAKPRPRFAKGRAYTPTNAREAEHRIAQAWGWGMLCGPLGLTVEVILQRPKGHYGKRGLLPSAPALPLTRPDLDNYVKTAQDALNGVAWQDDASVTDLIARKRYGEVEGWRITVEELG